MMKKFFKQSKSLPTSSDGEPNRRMSLPNTPASDGGLLTYRDPVAPPKMSQDVDLSQPMFDGLYAYLDEHP